jgi:hypothetical protein
MLNTDLPSVKPPQSKRTADMMKPSVGIFWFVADAAGTAHLLPRHCPIPVAEPYGDCLTFPDGHADTWEAWRDGALPLPAHALRAVITATEYDEWPRGRIVSDRSATHFIVYADRQLLLPARLARIVAAFALPPERTTAHTDPHYSRARRLPHGTAHD